MKEINIETWYRKDYYLFYKSFHTPLYGISTEADVTNAYAYCKEKGYSFFLFCLYVFLKATNEVPEFRHREMQGKVFDVEQVAATSPILKPDDENHQFTMVEFPMMQTFKDFHAHSKSLIEKAQKGIPPNAEEQQTKGLICLSCVPWMTFNGGHHGMLDTHQSMPLIDWGRFKEQEGKKVLPYFMQVNHMFIDGYHLAQFTGKVDEFFECPDKI